MTPSGFTLVQESPEPVHFGLQGLPLLRERRVLILFDLLELSYLCFKLGVHIVVGFDSYQMEKTRQIPQHYENA